MILSKALILKGLGGLTAVGGAAAAAYFVFSNNDSDAKALKKDLGLPEDDSDCQLPTSNNSSTTCTLDTNKLKKIKFDGKGEGEITIENGGTPTITLTITKTTDTTTYPKGGYKFAFESNKDITISSTSPAKYIKKNTNTEFKIKETTPSDGGAKTLSLEKAWTVTTLAEKVNIKCPADNAGSEKKCTIDNNKEISYKVSGNTDIKKLTTTTAVTDKITYEEDQEGFNQGFKFIFSENAITVTDGSETLSSGNYEIKEESGKWYLAKKETTNGVSG